MNKQLAEDADQLGPMTLDIFPFIFRKDILTHEAHRHPYLERIGLIYMTKLRHESFGNTACTSWRLLFVFALMPWLRKYRLRSGENGVDVNKFKFSKDSEVFKKFASGKALGGRGRSSLSVIEEVKDVSNSESGNTEDGVGKSTEETGDNVTSSSTNGVDDSEMIAELKKEIEKLKQENDMLRMVNNID